MSKKINERVNRTFTSATPDISQTVIADCRNTTVYRAQPQTKGNKVSFWKFATLALALVLVITGIIGGVGMGATTAQAATISLDVNPSIEIKVNGKNKVLEIIPKNQDAKLIVGDPDDYKGVTLSLAINALIGSMLTNGYITDAANSVLVSVDATKEAKYEEIIKIVSDKISVRMGEKQIEASILTQWIKDNDQAKALATKYNISVGKAQLITKIVSATKNVLNEDGTPVYTEEALVKLSVNELNIILGEMNIENLNKTGSASGKAYIGESVALEVALAKLDAQGVTAENITHKQIKLDFDDGLMVYEVEFIYGEYQYEFEIGANTGTIISFEQELADWDEILNGVELTSQQLVEKVLADAGVDATVNAQIESYAWASTSIVYFETVESYFEYEISNTGVIIYKAVITLADITGDQYMHRGQVEDLIQSVIGATDLDNIRQLRIHPELKDVTLGDGTTATHLMYNVSFLYEGQKYVGVIDAVEQEIVNDSFQVTDALESAWGNHFGDGYDHHRDDFEHGWDDHDWDRDPYFEFEYTEGGYEYEIKVDRWGNIVSESREWDDDAQDQATPIGAISQEEAKTIVARWFGVSKSELTHFECELETEHGMSYYDIEFVLYGMEMEIKINAITGEVLRGHQGGGNGFHYGW